jgi:hypothetical protein
MRQKRLVGIADGMRWESTYKAGYDQCRVILSESRSKQECDEYYVRAKISEDGGGHCQRHLRYERSHLSPMASRWE